MNLLNDFKKVYIKKEGATPNLTMSASESNSIPNLDLVLNQQEIRLKITNTGNSNKNRCHFIISSF